MSIKCAHCGGRHTKLETIRQCARDAGVEPILPKRNMWLPTLGQMEPVRHKPGLPPAGFYWLDGDIVAKVRIVAEGRWAGRYFVVACSRTENTEKAVFEKEQRDEFLTWLAGQGPTKFMMRYGIATGFCAACGGELSVYDKRIGYHIAGMQPTRLAPYGNACAEVVQGKYTIIGG